VSINLLDGIYFVYGFLTPEAVLRESLRTPYSRSGTGGDQTARHLLVTLFSSIREFIVNSGRPLFLRSEKRLMSMPDQFIAGDRNAIFRRGSRNGAVGKCMLGTVK
jgi:hypothetical protein